MLTLLTPYQKFGQDKLGVQIGTVDAPLDGDRDRVRKQPTNLGVMIGQAMIERTRADFAVVNAGGVRDSIKAGAITYKDVLKVQPFANTVCTVDLSGQEVMEYLSAAAKMSPGSGAFPQFAGVELEIAAGSVSQVRISGKALERARTYRLALNNFQAAGGDGYPKLTEHPSFVNTGFVDAEVLRAFITANSPLTAARYEPGSTLLRR
jgi:5'-nucleotidase/UDP-sugar diphosphatase